MNTQSLYNCQTCNTTMTMRKEEIPAGPYGSSEHLVWRCDNEECNQDNGIYTTAEAIAEAFSLKTRNYPEMVKAGLSRFSPAAIATEKIKFDKSMRKVKDRK